jgi:hypothetical protein
MKKKAHPFADYFPLMTDAELDALTEDVRANGLRHKIVLYQGDILDGRNRQTACERASVKPEYEEHEGDDASALALVISLNVQRRDLTAGQRAIVAARVLEEMPERRGGDQRKQNGKTSHLAPLSREVVAGKFKVSDKFVQQARALLSDAPDLAEQVENNTLSLASAYAEVQRRRQDVRQKAQDARRAAAYTEAVSNGEMTMEEALRKAMEDERSPECPHSDRLHRWLAAVEGETALLIGEGGIEALLAEPEKWDWDDVSAFLLPQIKGLQRILASYEKELENHASKNRKRVRGRS